jgi:hypothetical protein
MFLFLLLRYLISVKQKPKQPYSYSHHDIPLYCAEEIKDLKYV